jgi:uncharacterized membrane protein
MWQATHASWAKTRPGTRSVLPPTYRMAVVTRAMPLGNKTGMQDEQRDLISRWIDGGAQD